MKRLIAGMLLVGLILLPVHAHAHVLISDTQKRTGAVLHISPDDDPIAGEPSELFFELDGSKISHKSHSYNLSVTDSSGQQSTIPVQAIANTIAATYTFPSQGLYTISLVAESIASGGTPYHFAYSQRVSRGIGVMPQVVSPRTWAPLGIVTGGATLLVLGIIGFNKRKDIRAYSKF